MIVFKAIGALLALAFIIFTFLPMLLFMGILPFFGISTILTTVETGFSGQNSWWGAIGFILFGVSFSLQFPYIRKIYGVFPSLFRLVEFLTVIGIFVSLANVAICYGYAKLDATSHTEGIVGAVGALVAARIVLSIYYYKNPMVTYVDKDSTLKKISPAKYTPS